MLAFALLAAVMLALWSGPLLYAWASRRPRAARVLDGFVLVTIVLLIVLEAVPAILRDGGVASLAFLLAGLFGPTVLESLFRRAQNAAHVSALALAVFGLALHTMADGAIVASATPSVAGLALPLAIVAHNVPVSTAVWWLLFPPFGPRWPSLVLVSMCAATALGFTFGVSLESVFGHREWAWFQALVAGSILHVVFGRPHLRGGHAGHAHDAQ